jgi:hypothetical protein
MDPKLVSLLADYMEKTGSISVNMRDLLHRHQQYIEKQDNAKTASFSRLKTKSDDMALKLANTHLPSGETLISGVEQVKRASAMLSDPEKAIDLVNMIVDSYTADFNSAYAKRASLEPGKPIGNSNKRETTAREDLLQQLGVKPSVSI